MRKFYQTNWQDMEFSDVASVSSRELAGPAFYDAFYRALFAKYDGFDALDPDWRQKKDELADWIADELPDGAKVLSVGCGLGYMEQRICRQHGRRIDLHVQDYASDALRWLRSVMPSENIHDITDGGGAGAYDMIYLSAVDYALDDRALHELLRQLKTSLKPGGRVLMVSASFLDETTVERVVHSVKDLARWGLEQIGLYEKQFWGWMRTRDDYHRVMRSAGFAGVADGWVKTENQQTFWIKGQ